MQVALVTGSSYGLGKAISEMLLQNGVKVYGVSRTNPQNTHPHFIWIKADATVDSEIKKIPELVKEKTIDVLVNNVGHVFFQKTLDYTDRDFDKMFGLNFKSPIKITALLFPKLTKGLIINTSSDSDRSSDPELALYGSSKAALNIFFETMAEENKNVKIINILPTYIDTPFLHTLFDGTNFDWKKCLKPEEVAQSVHSIIERKNMFESGSRILILKKAHEDNVYNPEKLWVYTASNGSITKYYK